MCASRAIATSRQFRNRAADVMGKVLPQFKGRAEGSTINAIAREELSKQG